MLALELYLTKGVRPDDRDPFVRELASDIGRTPSAVALRLLNFRSLDSSGARGMSHAGGPATEIWKNFHDRPASLREALDATSDETPSRSTSDAGRRISSVSQVEAAIAAGDFSATDEMAPQKRRRYQAGLREIVLESYGYKCGLCEVHLPGLLTASHIVPWSRDEANRLNPHNVIALCALHDRAFDRGLIAFTDDGKAVLSSRADGADDSLKTMLLGRVKLRAPTRFAPESRFLAWHRANHGME